MEQGDAFGTEQRQRLSRRILEKYPSETATAHFIAPVKKSTWSRHRYWIAASFLLVLGLVAFWGSEQLRKSKVKELNKVAFEIPAGREGAILTLADHSQILLDTIKNAVVALQGGATARIVNGALVYENNGNEVVYNTMSTPKGRQFHLILPDGTTAWLNAASSIRYPTVFTGKERKVEVTGEVYFEVAQQPSAPFLVDVNHKLSIQVLGTHFNVKAYEDEHTIAATLLEGSIRVTGSPVISHQSSVTLTPGQQARINNGQPDITVVNKADLDKAMAWKNGLFNFEDENLQEIMRQLERWYDIEVVYEKQAPGIYFVGEISRDIPLKDVLSFLETTGIRFRIEERKLTVLN
jgi:ferric-dicitrate binding protein FerR (iron transport regulator)